MCPSTRFWCLLLAGATACAAPPDPTPSMPPAPALDVVCAALLGSPPAEWAERMAPVFAAGPAASPRLVAGLRDQPSSPGAEAAVALLGRLGAADAQPFLDEQVADRTRLAVEAALALGQMRATASIPTLLACTADRFADATLRTASACALVRCGERAAALPVLHAVLLAGTPAGVAHTREVGLPAKTRWALERYFVQRLLQQEGATDLAAALDTDAPWPMLEAVTHRIVAWLGRP